MAGFGPGGYSILAARGPAKAFRGTIHRMVPPSLFAHLFWGDASRPFFLAGARRTRPVPLCRCATFPPHCGGIFPAPAGSTLPLRSAPYLCATGARRPLKRLAKLLCFARLIACRSLHHPAAPSAARVPSPVRSTKSYNPRGIPRSPLHHFHP